MHRGRDGAERLTGAYRDYDLVACDAERLVGFGTAISALYPELRTSYEEEAGEGLAQVEGRARSLGHDYHPTFVIGNEGGWR